MFKHDLVRFPVLFILAIEFLRELPVKIYPFKDKSLPSITVTHKDDGEIVVATSKGRATLKSDDTLRYDSRTGDIAKIMGPSRYTNVFRRIVAGTRLGQSKLITDYDKDITPNDDEHPFAHEDFFDSSNYDGTVRGCSVVILVDRNGQGNVTKVYTRTGAENDSAAVTFFEMLVGRRTNKTSGAFAAYEAEVIQARDAARSEFERKEAERAAADLAAAESYTAAEHARFLKLRDGMIESGYQKLLDGSKTYFIVNRKLYRNAVSKKHQVEWQKAFEDGTLDRIAETMPWFD
jgi:hypothetical protein